MPPVVISNFFICVMLFVFSSFLKRLVYYVLFMCMCVRACKSLCAPCEYRDQRVSDLLELEITGSCEQPDVDAGNLLSARAVRALND